jgi:thiosulfate dehydrogenase [quinone] large subunit
MDALERFKDPRIAGAALLAARLWVGSRFVIHGLEKVAGPGAEVWVGDKAGVAVSGYLNGALAMAPGGANAGAHPEVAGWYAALIRDVFLPNAQLFSYLVAWGEVLVGIALVLGILTRFAAAMGVTMNLAFLFAGTSGDNVPMLLVGLPIVFGAAAGYYGVDRFLMPAVRGFVERRRGAPGRPIAGTPVPTTA